LFVAIVMIILQITICEPLQYTLLSDCPLPSCLWNISWQD